MKAFQFIYTKLLPEDSPWHKQDFHTAFYPTALLERGDVSTLELYIHVPKEPGFSRKQTIFYYTLQKLVHLVILDIRNLPDERDAHGRGGIHLCQGFLFPPELWQSAPTPLALFAWVQDALFIDRAAVLASPRLDRKTGDMAPIDITTEQLAGLSKTLPPLANDLERRLALLLNRLAETETPPFPLLLKGTSEQVTALLNRMTAYLPNDLKPRIGWDPGLDGGTLIYFPLKIAGFSRESPRGGSPLLIDLDTRTFQEQTGQAAYFQPQTPYQHWLYACPEQVTDKSRLERAHSLSCALLANQCKSACKTDQVFGVIGVQN